MFEKILEVIKPFFPYAFETGTKKDGIVSAIVSVVLYVVSGLVFGLLTKIPLLGFFFGVIGAVVGLYGTIALILGIYFFVVNEK